MVFGSTAYQILCSRNDAIGNVAVMGAAGGVILTATAWPDLIVAGLMAALFLWSSMQIIGRRSRSGARHRSLSPPNKDKEVQQRYSLSKTVLPRDD